MLCYFPETLMPHPVKGFLEINKDQIKFFVLQCEVLLYYQSEWDNLFNSASTWSEAGLFLFNIVPYPAPDNLKDDLTWVADEANCTVIFTFSCIPFFWDGDHEFIHSVGNSLVAQILLQILCICTTASPPPLINLPSIPGAFQDLILELF